MTSQKRDMQLNVNVETSFDHKHKITRCDLRIRVVRHLQNLRTKLHKPKRNSKTKILTKYLQKVSFHVQL